MRKIITARPPLALDPVRPSLSKLPRELLVLITELLEATSPRSIISLGLVNSTFYCLAKASEHRYLLFNVTAEEYASIMRRCTRAEATGLLSAVRELTVADRSKILQEHAVSHHKSLKTILRLLPLMAGLKQVNYCGNCVPNEMPSALKAFPQLALHAQVTVLGRQQSTSILPQDDLVILCGNLNLRSLDIKFTYFQPDHCLYAMGQLKCLLLSCQHLRRLTLDVAPASSAGGPSQQYCGLGFRDGDRLPALEELILTEYPFGHEPRNDGPALDFSSQGYPTKGSEVDFWADNFEWSRLRRLETPNEEFALKLMPKLTALEDFTYRDLWLSGRVASFHLLVPAALESISVPTLKSITVEGILRHSKSLRQLHIHHSETYQPDWTDNAMDLASLQHIQQECRLISDLSLDVARFGTWPYAVFDTLGSFPNLKRLRLWFELGLSDAERPVEPFVTFAAAEHIFSYIRSRCPCGRSSLERLTLYSGGAPPLGDGFPSPDAYWPLYNSTSFICQLSERDDEAAAGIFSVDCPKLPAYKQHLRPDSSGCGVLDATISMTGKKTRMPGSQAFTKLRKTLVSRAKNARGNKEEVDVGKSRTEASSEAELVARNGPTPRGQWFAHF